MSNDSNVSFCVDRHVGSGRPDDNDFTITKLDEPLDKLDAQERDDDERDDEE